MYFAIRDDDTCYFTKPEDLERNYSGVWECCPINLSVVPFQACTKTRAIPSNYWTGEAVFPLDENVELVRYLKEKIREKKIYVTMHGYSHKDETVGYEFETGQDLKRKVAQGKVYLEQVLGVHIRVFVPPHNALSRQGYEAVVSNGLSICSHVGRHNGLHGLLGIRLAIIRRLWSYFRNGPYPYPLRFRRHAIIGYQSLTPSVPFSTIKERFEYCRRWDGCFCLATHYWEFGARQQTGEPMNMGDVFYRFWREISTLPDVRFVPLERIIYAK